MNDSFKLENKSIIIYGAAAIGLIVFDICRELNLPVAGFIDKRGDEILEIQGVKVYSLDSTELATLSGHSVVFVAVKNVFEHDNIVRELLKKGFNNLIYRPYAVIKGKGSADEKILNDVYDKIMNKDLYADRIPKTFSVYQYEYKDYATIKKSGNERIVYVPIEILFTDLKKGDSRWGWLNIPIMALIPHIAFFRWLDQQEGYSYDMYLKFCIDAAKVKGQIKVTERWKQNVIKNRADVYSNMNESLERDFDFFLRNAPRAEWNSGGYFNLVSGKHRAAFWVSKGRHYIPLNISEADYENWINKSVMDKMMCELNEIEVFNVKAPVEHPFFYDMQCENKNFYYWLLCHFIYDAAHEQYANTGRVNLGELPTVLVSLNDDGYISRMLQKYGISVVVHNKSKVSRILGNLVKTPNEVSDSPEYSYALVEFQYGSEFSFSNIMSQNMKRMICVIPKENSKEFEQIIDMQYVVDNKRESLKDGRRVWVYDLMRETSSIIKY